jgi:hypothetical protein
MAECTSTSMILILREHLLIMSHTAREQRLQMRQRGAAYVLTSDAHNATANDLYLRSTRRTKEVDFGLSFTAPSVPSTTKTSAGPRRLSRKTPERSRTRPKSTRKPSITSSTRRSNTPSVVHGEGSERRGVFDIPIDENHEQEPRVGSLGGGHKRRRLNGTGYMPSSLSNANYAQ